MADWGKLGGNHSMHPAKGTGTQTPGKSSQEGTSSISSGQEPDAGPPSAGFYSSETTNKDFAGTKVAGTTAQDNTGTNAKFAEGGKNSMFGNRGSLPARGGYSSPG
jgi:hypothetical protein